MEVYQLRKLPLLLSLLIAHSISERFPHPCDAFTRHMKRLMRDSINQAIKYILMIKPTLNSFLIFRNIHIRYNTSVLLTFTRGMLTSAWPLQLRFQRCCQDQVYTRACMELVRRWRSSPLKRLSHSNPTNFIWRYL